MKEKRRILYTTGVKERSVPTVFNARDAVLECNTLGGGVRGEKEGDAPSLPPLPPPPRFRMLMG